MSGIEVAGLVLGVFPLVLAGINGYYNGLEQLQDMIDYRTQLELFSFELDMERTKFANTCYNILDDLATGRKPSSGTIDSLNFWRSPDVQSQLRSRLSEQSVKSFVEGAERIKKRLEELNEKFPPCGSSGKSSKYKRQLRKRFSHVMLKDYREREIQFLRRVNQDLYTLVNQSSQHDATIGRRKTKNSMALQYYRRVRAHAIALYEALNQIYRGSCRLCSTPHAASLELEFRSPYLIKGLESARQKLLLQCLLPLEHRPESKIFWKQLELEPTEDGPPREASPQVQQIGRQGSEGGISERIDSCDPLLGRSMSTPTKKLPVGESIRERASRRMRFLSGTKATVRFSIDQRHSTFHHSTDRPSLHSHAGSDTSVSIQSLAISNPSPQPVSPPNSEVIKDLCKAIRQTEETRCCMGVLISGVKEGSQRRLSLWLPPNQQFEFRPCRTVSLKGLLKEGHRGGLSLENRVRIGLKLASSIMELYRTEWLPDEWTIEDVLFLEQEHTGRPQIVIDRPLVQQDFCEEKPQSNNRPHSQGKGRINRSLWCLGIALTELWTDYPLEKLRPKFTDINDLDDQGLHRNMTTEDEDALVEWMNNQTPGDYPDVVRRCIMGLDVRGTDFDNDTFHQEVFERIVQPLEATMKGFSLPN